ncbi:isochorismatase family protein [Xylaria curta]|nr:isochorismatase family protein [Xylaria curta]
MKPLRSSIAKLRQRTSALFVNEAIPTASPAVVAQVSSKHASSSVHSSPIVVGSDSNFWLFTNSDGFDMTHPATPSSRPEYPRVTLKTTTSAVTIAPAKTALVIIDMQNFFLSTALGHSRGEGHEAEDKLLKLGIPAAREAGIQVIWLTWGISEAGLETLPPVVWRIFGWEIAEGGNLEVENDDPGAAPGQMIMRSERKRDGGIGLSLGKVKPEDGTEVDAGRMLMADQWNTDMHGALEGAYREGLNAIVPDVRFNKERISGFWGPSSDMEVFLRKTGITTLLFTGVNTDQCVLATMQDASTKGYDTILLEDGCGTRSPEYARQMVHFNCQKTWGFISTCAALAQGVENMIRFRGEANMGSRGYYNAHEVE